MVRLQMSSSNLFKRASSSAVSGHASMAPTAAPEDEEEEEREIEVIQEQRGSRMPSYHGITVEPNYQYSASQSPFPSAATTPTTTPSARFSAVSKPPAQQYLPDSHAHYSWPNRLNSAGRASPVTEGLVDVLLSHTTFALLELPDHDEGPSVRRVPLVSLPAVTNEERPVSRSLETLDAIFPSRSLPLPTILLVALGNMELLKQSMQAHSRRWPVKDLIVELKKLVAASMRDELVQSSGGPASPTSTGEDGAASGRLIGVSRTRRSISDATASSLRLPSSSFRIEPSTSGGSNALSPIALALRRAHGFLYGAELVPTGIPKKHLNRAHQQWIEQYQWKCVKRLLDSSQCRLLEAWRRRRRAVDTPSRGPQAAASPPPVPVPEYFSSSRPGTHHVARFRSVARSRPSLLLTSHGLNPGTSLENGAIWQRSAWEFDLYDDLVACMSAEPERTASNVLPYSSDQDHAVGKGDSADGQRPCTSSGDAEDLADAHLAGDMQFFNATPKPEATLDVSLPVFVYVISRHLFLHHYASCFPHGLFSRSLLDPYYFPESVGQCMPSYALRSTPQLENLAQSAAERYRAQVMDAIRCFPERGKKTDMSIAQDDILDAWALLCPPLQYDRLGRYEAVPWMDLDEAEENELLSRSDAGGPMSWLLQWTLTPLASRHLYRRRLQALSQHPLLLAEVHRLLSLCEKVAYDFFESIDTEQRGSIHWESFVNILIEEADVVDHERRVKDRAAHLAQASASVFDRYVVGPFAPSLIHLGYTGRIFEVHHSNSMVMVEGLNNYAVCDGSQMNVVRQRLLVRPVEVVWREMDDDVRDALFRRGDGDGAGSEVRGYDMGLEQRPWRHNQKPIQVYIRYEDGRRMQEPNARQLICVMANEKLSKLASHKEDDDAQGSEDASQHAHHPPKELALEGVMVVHHVSPFVPNPVIITRGNDMMLRFYTSNRAVQALPEAGLLHCPETVTSMEWGGGRRFLGEVPDFGSTTTHQSVLESLSAVAAEQRGLNVNNHEYIVLGTRSGTLLLVDLYSALHKMPRLNVSRPRPGSPGGTISSPSPSDTWGGGTFSTLDTTERIGTSDNAWAGYRDLARRTYYGDVSKFLLHRHQVHRQGSLVSSLAISANGVIISSGHDGDVYVLRLNTIFYSQPEQQQLHVPAPMRTGEMNGFGDSVRPVVRIQVLQRVHICETGVLNALPIPSLSMMAVHAASNSIYLYHLSVTPASVAALREVRGAASASTQPSSIKATTSVSSRSELYDAVAPHCEPIVSMVVVEDLDQLITVDSSGYVKVWGLRQSQLLTSFYAVAPLILTAGEAEQGADAARNVKSLAPHPSQLLQASKRRSAFSGSASMSHRLLRINKATIEAAVDAAEFRLQPCRAAAYCYAAKQLIITGSQSAAQCHFVSGLSEARAHTDPVQFVLVAPQTHRLISLSTADCRVWSLSNGAMVLGIRANNPEYRRLLQERLMFQGGKLTAASSANEQHFQPSSRSNAAAPFADVDTILAASAEGGMIYKTHKPLPPSVDDVISALAHSKKTASNRHGAAHMLPPRSVRGATGTTPSTSSAHLSSKQSKHHRSSAVLASGSTMGTGAASAVAEAEDDNSAFYASRDQNVIASEICCACLGPRERWIGYAMRSGEIRLHRGNSGRLLRSYVTTVPSADDVVDAVLRYQHDFLHVAHWVPAATEGAAARPVVGAGAYAARDTPGVTSPKKTRGEGGYLRMLPPALYVQAVPTVLYRLLTSNGSIVVGKSEAGKGGATPMASPSPSSPSLSRATNVNRDLHFEPIHMLYADSSQELLVTYADGLLRTFTLLGHQTTALRVVISKNLVQRALEYVLKSMIIHTVVSTPLLDQIHPPTTVDWDDSQLMKPEEVRASEQQQDDRRAKSLLQQLRTTDGVPLREGGTKKASIAVPACATESASPPSIKTSVLVEVDVVLLACASTQLGLLCLVYASGNVAVFDTRSSGTSDINTNSGVGAGQSGSSHFASSGSANVGLSSNAGCAMVHQFTTQDEVTAVCFLGAYPCLVVATKMRQLLFYLMPGASLLATVEDFYKAISRDRARSLDITTGTARVAAKQSSKLLKPSSSSAGFASPALVWAVSVDPICSSTHPIGKINVLSFDPTYCTLYLGTSDGYIVSFLLRRFITATQLTPIPIGSSDMSISSYAAALRQAQRRTMDSRGERMRPSGKESGLVHNILHLLFGVPPAAPEPVERVSLCSATLTRGRKQQQQPRSSSPTPHFWEDPLAAAYEANKAQFYYNVSRLSLGSLTAPGMRRQSLSRRSSTVTAVDGAHRTLSRHWNDLRSRSGLDATSAELETLASTNPQDGWTTSPTLHQPRHHTAVGWDALCAAGTRGSSKRTSSGSLPPLLASEVSLSDILVAVAVMHDAIRRMLHLFKSTKTLQRGVSVDKGSGNGGNDEPTDPHLWWCDSAPGRCVATAIEQLSSGREDFLQLSELDDNSPPSNTKDVLGYDNAFDISFDVDAMVNIREWVRTAMIELRSRCGTDADGRHREADRVVAVNTTSTAQNDGPVSCDETLSYTNSSAPQTPESSPFPNSLQISRLRAADESAESTKPGSFCESNFAFTSPMGQTKMQGFGASTSDSSDFSTKKWQPHLVAAMLVKDVRDELLFGQASNLGGPALPLPERSSSLGKEESGVASQRTAVDLTHLADANTADECYTPHIITSTWVEHLFTRQSIVMSAQSPLCLLTPTGMLERARREHLDRAKRELMSTPRYSIYMTKTDQERRRRRTGIYSNVDWHEYVEGTPSDFMSQLVRRQQYSAIGITEVENKDWAITTIQARRNGYVIVGYMNGGVSLWTPYACGRIENWCPSTSLSATLDRLEAAVVAQFRNVYARVVMARQRRVFECGTVMSVERMTQDSESKIKQRIKQILLNHYLTSLQDPKTKGERKAGEEDAEALGMDLRLGGVQEATLRSMRPLLCLLLGISSTTEMSARQLAMEDLFFLPLSMWSIATIEAFQAATYTTAVATAMTRLRVDLLSDDIAGVLQGTCATERVSSAPKNTSLHHPRRTSSDSGSSTPKHVGISYSFNHFNQLSIYMQSLPPLAQSLVMPPPILDGALSASVTVPVLAYFPGVVRLLLHLSFESLGSERVSRPCLPCNASQQRLSPINTSLEKRLRFSASDGDGGRASVKAADTDDNEAAYLLLCHALHQAELLQELSWESDEVCRAYSLLNCLNGEEAASNEVLGVKDVERASDSAAHVSDLADTMDSSTSLSVTESITVLAAVRHQIANDVQTRVSVLEHRAKATVCLHRLHLSFEACTTQSQKSYLIPSRTSSFYSVSRSGSCGSSEASLIGRDFDLTPHRAARERLSSGGGPVSLGDRTMRRQLHDTLRQPALYCLVPDAIFAPVSPYCRRSIATPGTADGAMKGRSKIRSPSRRFQVDAAQTASPVFSHCGSMCSTSDGETTATMAQSLRPSPSPPLPPLSTDVPLGPAFLTEPPLSSADHTSPRWRRATEANVGGDGLPVQGSKGLPVGTTVTRQPPAASPPLRSFRFMAGEETLHGQPSPPTGGPFMAAGRSTLNGQTVRNLSVVASGPPRQFSTTMPSVISSRGHGLLSSTADVEEAAEDPLTCSTESTRGAPVMSISPTLSSLSMTPPSRHHGRMAMLPLMPLHRARLAQTGLMRSQSSHAVVIGSIGHHHANQNDGGRGRKGVKGLVSISHASSSSSGSHERRRAKSSRAPPALYAGVLRLDSSATTKCLADRSRSRKAHQVI